MADISYSRTYANHRFEIGDCVLHTVIDAMFGRESVPKSSYSFHSHMMYELYIITQGWLVLHFDDKEIRLEENQFIIITPCCYHRIVEIGENMRRYSIRFQIERSSGAAPTGMFDLLSELLILGNHSVHICNESMLRRLRDIHSIVTGAPTIWTPYLMKEDMMLLFYEMFQLLQGLQTSLPQNTIRDEPSLHIIADNYFQDNYNRSVTVQDFAQLLNYSVTHTERLLKEWYGMTFKQKMIELRMKHAQYFLRCTDHSIDSIAEMVGYCDRKGFDKAFKHEFGQTPHEYRSSRD